MGRSPIDISLSIGLRPIFLLTWVHPGEYRRKTFPSQEIQRASPIFCDGSESDGVIYCPNASLVA
jgi:hypothetical protein